MKYLGTVLVATLLLLFGYRFVWPGIDEEIHPLHASRPEPTSDFKITDIGQSKEGPYRYVTGTVTNTSSRRYSYVEVEINMFDATGGKLGRTAGNANDIGPYEKWSLKAPITNDAAETFTVKNVAGY